MGSRLPRKRFRRAFSLMELIGATVLLLVLSILAMVGLRLYQRDLPVHHAGRRLLHAFAAARAYAIANNGAYSVKIDHDHANFWIDQTDAFGATIVPKVLRPESIDPRVRIERILLGANDAPQIGSYTPIRFFSDGSSDDVRIYLVHTTSQGGDWATVDTVRLYGPTGQGRLFENQRLTP